MSCGQFNAISLSQGDPLTTPKRRRDDQKGGIYQNFENNAKISLLYIIFGCFNFAEQNIIDNQEFVSLELVTIKIQKLIKLLARNM